jgi:glycosyltransferase involved in cell wall biosynthesis
VVPVLNEAHILEKSVSTIRGFLQESFPYPARILIADNGSTDGTGDIADALAARWSDVAVLKISRPGRGRALREAWTASDADIVAYTDVDISTDLRALESLCRSIWEDGYDVSIGSRLMKSSEVTRGFKRDTISRLYNLLVKCVLFTGFSDAQCGFKAVSRRIADDVVPLIVDDGWFFDTELLAISEKLGYRIKDVPVRWIDDEDSRVKIVKTAWEDIKGVLRVRRSSWGRDFRAHRQALRARRQTAEAGENCAGSS